MGYELGPGFQRRPPRGWIAARAFAVQRRILPGGIDESGSRNAGWDLSHNVAFTWEVRVDGREPVRFSEERAAPAWVYSLSPSGKRWYKPRLRPSYGLVESLGVPGVVDPADPTRLWIDWDAAYAEHEEAWEQRGRVERAVAERDGVWDRTFHRVFNPLEGKLREGEEALVEAEIARRAAEQQRVQDEVLAAHPELAAQVAAMDAGPVDPVENAERERRMAQIQRLLKKGRTASAVVVDQVDTGRTLAGEHVVHITLDVHDGGDTRRVVYEHLWGPRSLPKLLPGATIEVKLDPGDPNVLELA